MRGEHPPARGLTRTFACPGGHCRPCHGQRWGRLWCAKPTRHGRPSACASRPGPLSREVGGAKPGLRFAPQRRSEVPARCARCQPRPARRPDKLPVAPTRRRFLPVTVRPSCKERTRPASWGGYRRSYVREAEWAACPGMTIAMHLAPRQGRVRIQAPGIPAASGPFPDQRQRPRTARGRRSIARPGGAS